MNKSCNSFSCPKKWKRIDFLFIKQRIISQNYKIAIKSTNCSSPSFRHIKPLIPFSTSANARRKGEISRSGASDILKSHVQFYGWARGDKAREQINSLLLWDFIGLHSQPRSRSSASASIFRIQAFRIFLIWETNLIVEFDKFNLVAISRLVFPTIFTSLRLAC